MHHRGGAYSETQLIYGDPLRSLYQQDLLSPSILSIGLGLGYNEVLVGFESMKSKKNPRLVSYEAAPVLKEAFLRWVRGQEGEGLEIYNHAAQFFKKDYPEISIDSVRMLLLQAFNKGDFEIRGALEAEMNLTGKYHLFLYDAFSSKTSPHLWDEAFLTKMFMDHAEVNAQVTTYACTGSLKRSLKASGFEVILREGFQSKRNSTLGIRSVTS